MLTEVWTWNNLMLERVHDYIQWLFPLDKPSSVVPNAPILDGQSIRIFQTDSAIQANLRTSLDLMLRFYGFVRETGGGAARIVKSPDYPERREAWINPYNHNYLRITRILRCLMLSGLEDEARAFFSLLEGIYLQEETASIGSTAYGFWQEAVRGQ